jgi:hypothetical protein
MHNAPLLSTGLRSSARRAIRYQIPEGGACPSSACFGFAFRMWPSFE